MLTASKTWRMVTRLSSPCTWPTFTFWVACLSFHPEIYLLQSKTEQGQSFTAKEKKSSKCGRKWSSIQPCRAAWEIPDLPTALVQRVLQSFTSSIFQIETMAKFEPLGYLLGKARHSRFQSVNKETALRICSWLDGLKGSLVKQELGTVIEQVVPSRAKTLAMKEKGP